MDGHGLLSFDGDYYGSVFLRLAAKIKIVSVSVRDVVNP